MRFGVCGPLRVQAADGTMLPPGTPKQGLVLALLLVNANRHVTTRELVDEVWPDAPPASAVANLRGYAGWWRRLFDTVEPGRGRLVRNNAGYLLSVDAGELDLEEFAGHAVAGRDAWRSGDAKAAAARLADSLACWRGPMLAGLPHGPALAARCAAAHEERSAVIEELAHVHLERDDPRAAADLLHDHVRGQPLRERARLLLMRALYRLGDAPAALAAYREGRAVLSEQLGLEPGAELQRMHRVILAGSPDPPASAPAAAPVPAQLPLDVFGFTGRASELRQLDALLAGAGEQPTAVVISAIAGTAGVGKTATAVHWAHRVREEFPDGQLYVNLRGFDPTGEPVPPAQAIRGFLDALEVPAARIPADLDAQVGLYRTLLATRRLLVVLDNAHDADQVRPLLPGSPGCLVLVTSRNQLAGLIAAEGARPVTLDLLTVAEAHALLARRLGAERVAAEPDAVREIVTRCARLPLALAIAAARAATGVALATLAEELRDARGALDALAGEDPVTDVRAVFATSYRALGGPAARLFRLLGLHPGPDIAAPAAASLACVPVADVRSLLSELTRAHLLTEHEAGRYTFHDLLRAYATERADADETAEDREAALRRLLDHYLHTADAADQLLGQQQEPIDLDPASPGVSPGDVTTDGALAWFATEHRSLLALVALAYQAGFDTHAWQLARKLHNYFNVRGLWLDWHTSFDVALDAARRLGDPWIQARLHFGLAQACGFLGRYDDAYHHLAGAEEQYNLHRRRSRLRLTQCWLAGRQERHREAADLAQQALDLARVEGHRSYEGIALGWLGWHLAHLGRHREAVAPLRRSIIVQKELGHRVLEASAWDALGFALQGLARHKIAIGCYERAIGIVQALDERPLAAEASEHLGDAYLELGQTDRARPAWEHALALYDVLGQAEADNVRAKLARLDGAGSTRPLSAAGDGRDGQRDGE